MCISSRLLRTWLQNASAAIWIGALLPSTSAVAQNLVNNPGFETGNTSGWFAFGTPTIGVQTTQVHSGTYAAQVSNRTGTYMGIAQSFLGVLQPSQTYTVSAWVRLVSGSSQTMQLTFQKGDGNGISYAAVASASVTASAWTQIAGQYTFTPSGTATTLVLYAEMPSSSSNSYYIDDVVVQSAVQPATNGACLVNWTNVFQRIDGFGASSAWRGSWTTSQADMFFSTNSGTGTTFDGKTNFAFNGVGFSLLRNHITYAGDTLATTVPTTAEVSIMQLAQARGATVWSAPWTPAAGFKGTNEIYDSKIVTNVLFGGNYLGSGNNITNRNYASQLANYVSSMKNTYGVNIYGVSVQNEPDASVVSYEACQWTGDQIHDFVTNLSAAFDAKGVGSTKILMPESQNWTDPHNLMGPALGDPTSLASVDIVADHNYVADNINGDTSTPSAIATSGKALWETEVSQINGPYDGSINNAVYWAGRVHLFLTAAQANAYHYWWLVPLGTDNEGLVDVNGYPAKRMYALGQFARFVRPNYYRIGIDTNSSSAQISAYKDSTSSNFAIVAINSGSTSATQVFNLGNVTGVTSVTPWITSATMSLSNQTAVAVSGSSFTYILPAMSIVTFVGQAAPPAGPAPTTLNLVSGANPSTYGSAVTFTATVKTNGVAVGGISGETVTFYNGATQLGTGALNGSGQASYTSTANQLAAGSPSITAVYPGDVSFVASTNTPALAQTVNPATLTYAAGSATMVFGAPVPGLSGSVSGFAGSDTLANATTGTLTFTTLATSSSPSGSYTITGSGLTANNGNYTFIQAAGNATALNILPLVTPVFAGSGVSLGAGGTQLSFSAQAGQTYQVLVTSDLTLPLASWNVLTNGTFDAGVITITDPTPGLPQRFYILLSP
jgi:glucuronoarabinoxylan endo-1,4-beta-xylanase